MYWEPTSNIALPPQTELVVTSPGVPKTAPVLQAAVQRNIPVWSEIELAYRLTNAPIIAITGTNGKTTTTLLIAHILQTAGNNALVAGNISADEIKRTLVEAAWEVEEEKEKADEEVTLNPQPSTLNPVLVAEISSFQLEWVENVCAPCRHSDQYHAGSSEPPCGFEEYAQTKARIFAAQRPDDWAIVNHWNLPSRQIGFQLAAERALLTLSGSRIVATNRAQTGGRLGFRTAF